VWKQQIYIGDLLPTLAAGAGISLDPELHLDGLNLWSALKYGYESVEREIVHVLDEDVEEPHLSYTRGKWKVISGTTSQGLYDGWLGERVTSEVDPRSEEYEDLIRNVIVNDQPWGLPLNETTMAEIFRENGYRTSLLGKWHLGMSQRNFTPTQRGFDRHLGYLGAYVDYYTQSYEQKVGNTSIFT